ncbi:hypothetical protein L227DRAFT_305394 [Lentinus tigrinus ALCF2SS1-6]|uniref:Uncharacterized protein n=1 Tax=Lentinus tigrinus ALCF2SS1-6 TaxID=1328759 RepID=A0A5C2RW19_9APHY|nr:hypothetical protein L227DRAFT_305394 [Lentinus tigrinus ALCF2SS1-6]
MWHHLKFGGLKLGRVTVRTPGRVGPLVLVLPATIARDPLIDAMPHGLYEWSDHISLRVLGSLESPSRPSDAFITPSRARAFGAPLSCSSSSSYPSAFASASVALDTCAHLLLGLCTLSGHRLAPRISENVQEDIER